MGLFGPSREEREMAARYDAMAEASEGVSRELRRKARHHREQSQRTDPGVDVEAHRGEARIVEGDAKYAASEADQYRTAAAYARRPWWRR